MYLFFKATYYFAACTHTHTYTRIPKVGYKTITINMKIIIRIYCKNNNNKNNNNIKSTWSTKYASVGKTLINSLLLNYKIYLHVFVCVSPY